MITTAAWGRLHEALSFYEGLGYEHVDVPWITPTDINRITCPEETRIFMLAGGQMCLPGSSEQSFLMMEESGDLGRGKFVALTPCFRKEKRDETHQNWFMKVELYRNDLCGPDQLMEMIAAARACFRLLGEETDLVATSDGFDLEIAGLEVGSYGIRGHRNQMWVYGTGLAEPRFSIASRRG